MSRLSDYHFSVKTLPLPSACLKKYSLMFFSAFGGLGYWSATTKYNETHDFSEWEAQSNTACVVIVTSLFLLQSVDLARNYLNKLAGAAPVEISEILDTVSADQRRSVKLKTVLGSSISGLPFLIIALNDSLPFIESNHSDWVRKIGLGLWASYFYIVNVGLHILPFALLQTSQFDYYLLPVKAILAMKNKCKNKIIAEGDRQIEIIYKELESLYDEVRFPITRRISSSLDHFYKENDINQTIAIFSESTSGLNRLLELLNNYPPLPVPDAPSPIFQKALRVFGAHLELGAAFIWWTNIFPTLYTILNKTGMNLALVYVLTTSFGLVPSYVLFVLLSFFGENQFPRLINYLINCAKKILCLPNTIALLPPIAKARPILFGFGSLVIAYLTWFSSVNAKSLNEEQYQDIFPDWSMSILTIYADIGLRMMAFIALQDFFSHYVTEISSVFGRLGSVSQIRARLLVTNENLSTDLMRINPKLLIAALKELKVDSLKLLLGDDKGKAWLLDHDKKIVGAEERLDLAKSEKKSSMTAPLVSLHQIQESARNSDHSQSCGFLSRCYTALFANCFSRCRRAQNSDLTQALLVKETLHSGV